ncbi:MAG TPA: DUF6569 family protein [Planctomycetota bacterium]|nr:DUF6569 family protein [Planctomycetota bacterium]
MRSTCVALLFLFAAGCGAKHGSQEAAQGPDVVAQLDDHHVLTTPVTVGNLTVWPVRTDRPLDLGEFLTLEEALAKGAAEVRETGGGDARPQQVAAAPGQTRNVFVPQQEASAPPPADQADEPAQTLGEAQELEQQLAQVIGGATVNTLVIENKGDLPILVCAGTVVKGGNQDRQIGQDFVIKAKSETPVDAFCVEPGRWQQERLGTDTGGKFQVLDGMATAKVRAKGQYEKDQGGVWQEVAQVREQAVRPVSNTTVAPMTAESTSYAVAFDANAAASREDLKRCEDAVKARFAQGADVVGFAYAINGKPVAVRTFAHPRLLKKQLDDFVRGMATEALLGKTDAATKPADAKDVVALVERISASGETVSETSGLNRNGVRVHADGFNANCYIADKEGKLQPLTQDWTAK